MLGKYQILAAARGSLDGKSYYRQTAITTEVYEPIDLYLNDNDLNIPSNITEGQQVLLSATIRNKGNVSLSNITVEFYDDDPAHGSVIGTDVIAINANSATVADTLWTASQDVRYIYAVISPFNAIIEENYTNNIANKTVIVQIGQANTYQIPLNSGYSLISFPLDLSNKQISSVFASNPIQSIFTYDNGWKYYYNATRNNFITINESFGYWVKSLNNQTLTITGNEFTSSNIQLKQGWNLVGYKELNQKTITASNWQNYTVLTYVNSSWLSYAPNKTNSLTTITPGKGYWVRIQ